VTPSGRLSSPRTTSGCLRSGSRRRWMTTRRRVRRIPWRRRVGRVRRRRIRNRPGCHVA